MVYQGMSIVDPDTRSVLPGAYILIEEGRIAGLGQGGLPAGWHTAPLQNMSGLYAMAGLIDTHAHITLGPAELVVEGDQPKLNTPHRPDIINHNSAALLSAGVTTVRNPAGDGEANRLYAQAVAADPTFGPEARYAGEVIDRPAFPFDGLVTQPTPDLSVRDIVNQQAEAGAHFIKLYENLTEADLVEGIAAAREHALPTIAHLSDVSWIRAAQLGVNAFVHLMPTSPELLPEDVREDYISQLRPGGFKFFEWWELVDLEGPQITELIQVLATEDVHVEATLIAFEPAYWGDDAALLARASADTHPDMMANWESGFRFDMGWEPIDYERAKAAWPKVLRFLRMLHEAGVPLTIGTDLANPFVSPSGAMAREMVLHGEAGIPAWDVLRMATSDAADRIGVGERTGRLAIGKEADIVFLGRDPSLDLSAVSDVRAVLNNGVAVRSALDQGHQADR
ncbi:amidohydrolase family protein [Brevundimonas sp. BH3]|uniref:amidohydrolase family protein n=1 Tax=Brevundimonas sp. BH3 TaxID=3133089 RepID=UPI00324F5562